MDLRAPLSVQEAVPDALQVDHGRAQLGAPGSGVEPDDELEEGDEGVRIVDQLRHAEELVLVEEADGMRPARCVRGRLTAQEEVDGALVEPRELDVRQRHVAPVSSTYLGAELELDVMAGEVGHAGPVHEGTSRRRGWRRFTSGRTRDLVLELRGVWERTAKPAWLRRGESRGQISERAGVSTVQSSFGPRARGEAVRW